MMNRAQVLQEEEKQNQKRGMTINAKKTEEAMYNAEIL